MWLMFCVRTVICFLFVHVQVTKQETVQPSHQDVMNAVLNVFEDKLTDLLEDKLTDIFEDSMSDFMENQLRNLLENKMVKLLENNLPDLLAEQLSDVHYRLRKMEDTLDNVKDDLAIIRGNSLPMYTKIEDIEKSSSQTLLSIEKGELIQEQTLSEINDVNQNISDFLQIVNVKAVSLEENISDLLQTVNVKAVSLEENLIEALNETSQFLQIRIQELHNSSAVEVGNSFARIQELHNSSAVEARSNFGKLTVLPNVSVDYKDDTEESCLPPFEWKSKLGCVSIFKTAEKWRHANLECKVIGAQLLVNPPHEPLLQYITEEGYSTSPFWTGGKYYGNWRWLNNEMITEGWADDEPDYTMPNECVYFNYEGNGQLNDHSCNEEKKYICEISKKELTVLPNVSVDYTMTTVDYMNTSVVYRDFTLKPCLPPFEWKPYLGCVRMFTNAEKWRHAHLTCRVIGAQLIVDPPLEHLLQYITEEGYRTTQFWIGGKFYGNWRWLNNETLTDGWAENEPDHTMDNKCVYFNNGDGLLFDHSCEEKKKFICEIS
ncbi:unnamed protein product [Meganyctiphanes norvegica]|uniref:C-type lectin domain-containing protein n=1 Tax=Meganyctiphanes norvegica TaxID=48144 RepID=A0AAV2QNR1_MEGNR